MTNRRTRQNKSTRQVNTANNKQQLAKVGAGSPSSTVQQQTNIDSELAISYDTYAQNPAKQTASQGSNATTDPKQNTVSSSSQNQEESRDIDMTYETIEITKKKLYYALALLDAIPGKNALQKKKWCSDKFRPKLAGFVRTEFRTHKILSEKKTFMAIVLDNHEDLISITSNPIEIIAGSDDVPPVTLKFEDQQTIKPPKPDEEIENDYLKTIQVIDIPMHIKAHVVRATFERYGAILSISMKTVKYYQHAFIKFANKEIVDAFYTTWSVFIGQECVRVIPLALQEDQRQKRKDFCVKLSGLPRGTAPRDIIGILDAVNAKACFIPRNPKSYKFMNHAYIYFDSAELLEEMTVSAYSFEGYELIWVAPDVQTCYKCGDPGHIFKECNLEFNRRQVDPNLERLYKKFKPANHRHNNNKKTYADATKKVSHSSPSQTTTPILTGTSSGGSLHGSSQEKSTATKNSQLDEIKKQFTAMQTLMMSYNQDLEQLKLQFAKSNPSPTTQSHSTSSHSPRNTHNKSNQQNKNKHKRVRVISGSEDSEDNGSSSATSDPIKKLDNLTNVSNNLNTMMSSLSKLVGQFVGSAV